MSDVEKQVQTDPTAKVLGEIIWRVAKTPPAKSLVMSVVRAALKDWSGDSRFREHISANVEKTIDHVLSMGREESRIAEDASYAESLRPIVRELVEKIDFGEIKEAADFHQENIAAAVMMINEELWRYPAKVICLLSLVPAVVNMGVSTAKESLVPINKLAPDLLADVVFSLVDNIDGKNIGRLINELAELVRKIHTGSTLLGEPGKPQLPYTLSRLTGETMSTVDINLLLKVRKLRNSPGNFSRTIFFPLSLLSETGAARPMPLNACFPKKILPANLPGAWARLMLRKWRIPSACCAVS